MIQAYLGLSMARDSKGAWIQAYYIARALNRMQTIHVSVTYWKKCARLHSSSG